MLGQLGISLNLYVSFHETAKKWNDTPCLGRFHRFFGSVVPYFGPNSPRHLGRTDQTNDRIASMLSIIRCCIRVSYNMTT